jgi:hypothetical protein
MRHSITARAFGILAPLSILVMLSAQPAAASVTFTSGSPGNYTVTDTDANPAARCIYPKTTAANQDLAKVKIHPPTMYAKSGTQWVGWQYSIQHGKTAGSDAAWVTYYKSSVMKGQATTGHAAPFSTQTWTAGNHLNRFWRVKLLMFWYTPSSKTHITGQINWLDTWYTVTYPPNPDYSNPDHCLPGL